MGFFIGKAAVTDKNKSVPIPEGQRAAGCSGYFGCGGLGMEGGGMKIKDGRLGNRSILVAFKDKQRIWKWIGLFAIVVAGGLYLHWLVTRNPLPRDEEMIENFQTHRQEFQELVRSYQEYVPQPGRGHGQWEKNETVRGLYKKTGVKWLSPGNIWSDNPYEVATALTFDDEIKKPDWNLRRYRHEALIFNMSDQRYARIAWFHPGSIMWKSFYYIPVVPRIERGNLLQPIYLRGKVKLLVESKVLDSLNDYPEDWKRGDCALRQIEAHWFISMCNG